MFMITFILMLRIMLHTEISSTQMLSLVFVLSLLTYLYRITYFLCYTKPAAETFALLPAELGTNIFFKHPISNSPIVHVLNQISDSLKVVVIRRTHNRYSGSSTA
jgi:hypothetical protein